MPSTRDHSWGQPPAADSGTILAPRIERPFGPGQCSVDLAPWFLLRASQNVAFRRGKDSHGNHAHAVRKRLSIPSVAGRHFPLARRLGIHLENALLPKASTSRSCDFISNPDAPSSSRGQTAHT